MISKNLNSQPIQKLPMSRKTEEWKKANVDFIIGKSGFEGGGDSGRTRYEEMQTYYDLYNSIYNEKDLLYVTNPFKQKDGFPATAQDYNIIKPKIDLLLGEETKRPFNFRVVRTSDIATSEVQEQAKQMLTDYVMATIMSKLGPEEAQRYQEALLTGEIMTPEQIQKYISRDYKDIAETTAQHSLNYLKNKLNVTHEFFKGWKDALIAGEEIYYVGIINGDPYLERVNPIYFSYDQSADLEFIHDADWCCRKMIMSATAIYDRFYDKMSEKQLNELLEMIEDGTRHGINPEMRKTSLDYPHIKTHSINGFSSNPFDDLDNINVWHACWKSFKKIGFVTVIDPETGQPEEFEVDETYKVMGNELNVEWTWIIEVWEGYRIGEDLYVGIQPLDYQHVSADNPNSQRLPYTGVVYNNTNSKPRSLVSMMKPLQYMYIVLWYRLELALARDKGRVALIDVSQIPKSMGIDVNKWMHYLSALGVAFINPYECFAPETEVMMADGSIKMIKDIQLGEQVMGPDGKPRNVLASHAGIDNMYRLKVLTGGEDQVVNSKHQIYYKQKHYHTNSQLTKLATPVDLLNEEKDTKYLANLRYLQRTSKVDKNWNKEVLLDPYLLGLWLGDGCTGKPCIINEDKEVIKYLVDYSESNGMRSKVSTTHSNAFEIYLSNSANGKVNKYKNQLKEALRHYGILNNKAIPADYIYTTKENRLKLLAGLIDTDGYYSKRDRYYVISQSESRKHIIDSAAFIARSLGFKCTVNRYEGGKKQIQNNNYLSICEPTWQLRILDGEEIIPVLIERKKGSVKKTKGNALQSNFRIQYEGVGEYCGITVDGDNLFVLKDFTIVHNCGWETPGRDGSHPAQFNQFQSLDLTMANSIDAYIGLMDKIESMISEITGVTKQREGAISSNELVGNVERSVILSAHITEPLFWVHNQVKREALTMLLDTSKAAWKGNKRYLHYVLDDATRAYITLSDEYFYEDMDIFLDDSTKNQQALEQLKNLMQPAMQNGASLLDVAEVITMDNINSIKNRLEEIEQKRMEQQQAAEQAQAEREQQMIQMQNEVKEEELMIKEAEMDLKKYEIDQNNATKITVAQLNAYRGTENMDQNLNGIPDPMEIASQALEERKVASEEANKQLELNNKRREAEMKKEIENKKIQLEKERMDHEMKLQKAKDDAAYKREQLKAKTAKANKVVGEQ